MDNSLTGHSTNSNERLDRQSTIHERQPGGCALLPAGATPTLYDRPPAPSLSITTASTSSLTNNRESTSGEDESMDHAITSTSRLARRDGLITAPHEQINASSSSPAGVTFGGQSSAINAPVLVQGATYNIGGSASVNLNYGAHLNQQPDKDPLDEIIQKLVRSCDAEYNIVVNTTRGPCTPETRTTILQKLRDWCNVNGVMLYWMNGMAGTGKTTIAYSFCEMLELASLLGASFFCSRSVADCRNVNTIFSTIAYQLARRYPSYAKALAETLHQDPDISKRSLDVQLRELILKPWTATWKKEERLVPIVIVIDALDECDGDLAKFLRILFDHVAILPFKILITSRPEFSVYNTLMAKDPSILSRYILHDVERDLVQADIAKYLESELSHCTSPAIIHTLKELSGSLFIYAATLARIFKARNVNIHARLQVLQAPSAVEDKSKMMASLDELYKGVLVIAFADLTEGEVREIKDILDIVICAREPLTRRGIAALWRLDVGEVGRRLQSLLSIISVPLGIDEPITVFHASFPDFMLDQSRSGKFCCHPLNFNLEMAKRCLSFMKSELHQDLCHLGGRPPNATLTQEIICGYITPVLQYACVYWLDHWVLSDRSERQAFLSSVDDFLTTMVLCWFECLSLVGRLDVAIQSLEILQDALDKSTDVQVVGIVYECLRFIQHVYDIIQYSAMETYYQALAWIPSNSVLRTHYGSLCEQAPQVCRGLPATWTGPDQAIHIHPKPNIIHSIAVSGDGRFVISASEENIVRIWNVRSHVEEPALRSEYACHITQVVISGDGSLAASVDDDGHVHVWNIATHGTLFTLPHLTSVGTARAVALSPNNKWIALGYSSGFIQVHDVSHSHLIHSLQGSQDEAKFVSFTHDSTRLVFGSGDSTVCMWNIVMGKTERALRGHTDIVTDVACSPNDDTILTGSWDCTACLWDISGKRLRVLHHSSWVICVIFMPDGKQVVTGSFDRIIQIWDVRSGNMVRIFAGLPDLVLSVAVFPDGLKIASSSGSTIFIRKFGDGTPGGPKKRSKTPIPDMEADIMLLSADGKRVLLLPSRRLLDTATLEEKGVLGPDHASHCGVWSLSRTRVAATQDRLITVWKLKGNDAVAKHFRHRLIPKFRLNRRLYLSTHYFTLEGHTDSICSVSFSHDERQIVSASDDNTARVWDVVIGKQIHILDHPGPVCSAAFSHDNTQLASTVYDYIYIWDAQSGQQLSRLPTNRSHIASFSPDDRHVITFHDEEGHSNIRIYSTRPLQFECEYKGYRYWSTMPDNSSYALSDDTWICHFSHFGDEPRRLLWIPSQYKPSIYKFYLNGPLFTPTSTGVQVCLPAEHGLVTLVIPHGT